MKFLLTLAGRNLFRNKMRTIVSLFAIAIAVMVVIFARGLIIGILDSSYSLYIQYDSGHLKVIDETYDQKEKLLSLRHPVDGFEGEGVLPMVEEIESIEGINIAIPRLKFGAMASPGDEIVRMLGWGVDPDKELEFTDIKSNFVRGRMVEANKREMVLGSGLLDKLDKSVGDSLTIVYNNSFDSFKGSTFEIVGEIDHYLPLINNRLFYIPLDQAQRILIMENSATEILIRADSMNEADAIKPNIEQIINNNDTRGKYIVQTWDEANPMLKLFDVAEYIYNVVYVLLIILAAVVVINTMVMIVKERTQEIGMMRALGLRSKEILTLFIIEGSFLGIVGSFFGAIFGGMLTKYLSVHGIDYTQAVEGMMEEFFMNPVLYPVYNLENVIFGFLLGSIVTALTCIIPARRAAKLEPHDALRNI